MWLYDHVMNNDGRRKVMKCHIEKVNWLHAMGHTYEAIRGYMLYSLSKSKIWYILHPEEYKRNRIQSKKWQGRVKYRDKGERQEDNRKSYHRRKEVRERKDGKQTLF